MEREHELYHELAKLLSELPLRDKSCTELKCQISFRADDVVSYQIPEVDMPLVSGVTAVKISRLAKELRNIFESRQGQKWKAMTYALDMRRNKFKADYSYDDEPAAHE